MSLVAAPAWNSRGGVAGAAAVRTERVPIRRDNTVDRKKRVGDFITAEVLADAIGEARLGLNGK